MEEYIKLFENHTQYETYKNSADYVTPNVSYCEEQDEVHYNPIETKVVCKYNIADISESTRLLLGVNINAIDEMEIDGIISPSIITNYQFETLGEHIVKYKLIDNTFIPAQMFARCPTLISVFIPNSVIEIKGDAYSVGVFGNCNNLTSVTLSDNITSIGAYTFQFCRNLTNITIPNTIRAIGKQAFCYCDKLTSITIGDNITAITEEAFRNCSALTSITIKATNPPTLSFNVFTSTNNCPIYVPSESVETYKAASGWSSYKSRIQAIPSN